MDQRWKSYKPPKYGWSILQKILDQRAYFQTPQKIFKYYSVAFGVTRWFVELKMTISEQFELLNLNKEKRKLCTDEGGGVKMKKNEKKKPHFAIWKNVFSFLLFFGCSFGFAFQRWFVKLEKALLYHYKSLQGLSYSPKKHSFHCDNTK
jgi:hypothetical protein